MATGSLDANGIWQYGEDDSNTTFSALLNRLGTSIGSNMKGRIAQVVSVEYSTGFSTNATSPADTGLTATITPKFSTSKILVLVDQQGFVSYGGPTNEFMFKLVRGTTSLTYRKSQITAGGQSFYANNIKYLDSPATTSAITYKTQTWSTAAANSIFFQWPWTSGSTSSTITLIEITA